MKFKKKILGHNHDKYITTQEFNKLKSENFEAILKQADLARKNNIADLWENIFWWCIKKFKQKKL